MTDQRDFDDADWPKEWMDQNTEVYLALSNLRENPAQVIVDFLRSNIPIHPLLRSALANAFEGTGAAETVRFDVRNVPYGPNTPGGWRRLRRDVEVADFVAARRAEGAKRSTAEREAAERFAMGEDKCHKAVTEVKKMRQWIAANVIPADRMGFDKLGVPEMWERFAMSQYALHLAGKLA